MWLRRDRNLDLRKLFPAVNKIVLENACTNRPKKTESPCYWLPKQFLPLLPTKATHFRGSTYSFLEFNSYRAYVKSSKIGSPVEQNDRFQALEAVYEGDPFS